MFGFSQKEKDEKAKRQGEARSPEWPKVRLAHLATQPLCQVCNGKKDLEAIWLFR